MQPTPEDIQLIGCEVAIRWSDGHEDFIPMDALRAHSPSAENTGERDIMGNLYGGNGPREFPGVSVEGWNLVGNYAVRFYFSDGHNTGLYSYPLIREIGEKLGSG